MNSGVTHSSDFPLCNKVYRTARKQSLHHDIKSVSEGNESLISCLDRNACFEPSPFNHANKYNSYQLWFSVR